MASDDPIDINEKRLEKVLAENERLHKLLEDQYDELYSLDIEELVMMIKVLVEKVSSLKQELNESRGKHGI